MVPHPGRGGTYGRILPFLWFPCSHRMIRSLTRSRSPEFHRATMLRLTVAALLLWILWEPIRPVRHVTAQALYTAGDLIAR
jgi:hypothetical protein